MPHLVPQSYPNSIQREIDRFLLKKREYPIRGITSLKPLIDGSEIISTMEEEIFEAKKAIFMVFHEFDPMLSLRNRRFALQNWPTVYRFHLKTWADLLIYKALSGVKVYLFLNDSLPYNSSGFKEHRNAWRACRIIHEKLLSHSSHSNKLNLKVLCSRHPNLVDLSSLIIPNLGGVKNNFLKTYFEEKVDSFIDKIKKFDDSNTKKREDLEAFRDLPALWKYIEYNLRSNAFIKKGNIDHFTVGINHQRYLIIDNDEYDENVLILGGMDPVLHRIHENDHDFSPTQYHEFDVLIKGSDLIHDAFKNFIELWNRHIRIFNLSYKELMKYPSLPNSSFPHIFSSFSNLTPSIIHPSKFSLHHPFETFNNAFAGGLYNSKGKGAAQIIYTATGHDSSKIFPKVLAGGTFDAFAKAIGSAEEYIYIETQYIRSERIVNAIKNRKKVNSKLKVIFLLNRTLQVASPSPSTMAAIDLEERLINELYVHLGADVGFFYLHIDALFSVDIYVNSKLMMIDDKFMYIGSANVDERSFKVDQEMGISVVSEPTVRRFRIKLWDEYFRYDQSIPLKIERWMQWEFLTKWNMISSSRRPGFVYPLKLSPNQLNRKPFLSKKLQKILGPKLILPNELQKIMELLAK